MTKAEKGLGLSTLALGTALFACRTGTQLPKSIGDAILNTGVRASTHLTLQGPAPEIHYVTRIVPVTTTPISIQALLEVHPPATATEFSATNVPTATRTLKPRRTPTNEPTEAPTVTATSTRSQGLVFTPDMKEHFFCECVAGSTGMLQLEKTGDEMCMTYNIKPEKGSGAFCGVFLAEDESGVDLTGYTEIDLEVGAMRPARQAVHVYMRDEQNHREGAIIEVTGRGKRDQDKLVRIPVKYFLDGELDLSKVTDITIGFEDREQRGTICLGQIEVR